jgi:hypothetical protein
MKLIALIVCLVALQVVTSFRLNNPSVRKNTQSLSSIFAEVKAVDANARIPQKSVKYVLVTGGVISGIGKGITASSLGVLLKMFGLCTTAIKIDP